MKQQLRFIAALSAIALSALTAQAQTTYPMDNSYPNVEVYPFLTWAPEKKGNTFTQTPSSTSYTATNGSTIYIETGTLNGHSFNSRIAYDCTVSTTTDDNGNETKEITGTTISGNKGLLVYNKSKNLSVVGLQTGDVITITYEGITKTKNEVKTIGDLKISSNNVSYLSSDGTTTSVTETALLESGKSYTITSGTTLDLKSTNSNGCRIQSLTIVRPTITLGSTGYGTYTNLTSNDFKVPAGLKAYTATSYDGNNVTLTSTDVIPAGMGVVLKGTANTAYTFSQQAATGTTATNYMQPVTEDVTLAATTSDDINYILSADANGSNVGFYPSTGNGTLAAGKSYLSLPTSSPAKLNIVFDNNAVTGINSVEADGHKGRNLQGAYNLSGQRVGANYHGIVIINGKKVIRK